MTSGSSLRQILTFLSIGDILFSVVFFVVTGLYAVSCKVEDLQVINYDVTLEKTQFFYDALKSCGFREERDIPKSSTTCAQFEIMVIPYVMASLILNFLLGVYIQIIIRDRSFLNKNRKAISPISFVLIPLGTLTAMCISLIGIHEFNKPKFCWLNYSVSTQTNSATQLKMTILASLILSIYKPIELGVFYFYGSKLLVNDQEELKSQPSTTRPNHPAILPINMNPVANKSVIRTQPYFLQQSAHQGPNFATYVQ